MLLSVVIPVYNEQKTLEKIVEKVLSIPIEKELVIVDDGSTDNSPKILSSLKEKYPEINVVFKEKNMGKGHSLGVGFKHTKGDYVIVQDADLEYEPVDIQKLLDTICASKDPQKTAIYGSRFMNVPENMLSTHFFGNKLLTLITNILFGVALTDMETCYKLIPGNFARDVEIKSLRFDFEPEITAKLSRSGYKIIEVPIQYNGRSFSEGKKITWRDGLAAVSSLLKHRFL